MFSRKKYFLYKIVMFVSSFVNLTFPCNIENGKLDDIFYKLSSINQNYFNRELYFKYLFVKILIVQNILMIIKKRVIYILFLNF